MSHGSHVPKFGNWDDDNIPYTIYFENARKEKGGNVMINPNDPEQNPEAFMNLRRRDHETESEVLDPSFGQPPVRQEKNTIATIKNSTPGSASNNEISGSDNPAAGYRSEKSSRHRGKTSDTHPSDENIHHRTTSIPKFGDWDEADPSSGEGFTIIFSKAKDEKHNASTSILSSYTNQPYSSHDQRNQPTSPKYKLCCCPFSCRRKLSNSS